MRGSVFGHLEVSLKLARRTQVQAVVPSKVYYISWDTYLNCNSLFTLIDFTREERRLLELQLELPKENEYQRSIKELEIEGKERVNTINEYRRKYYLML
jgi:hypothetical protein